MSIFFLQLNIFVPKELISNIFFSIIRLNLSFKLISTDMFDLDGLLIIISNSF